MARPSALLLLHGSCTLLAIVLHVLAVSGQKWKTDFGPCYRDCTREPEPHLCYFKFTEEIYASLTGACKNCSAGVTKNCFLDQCVPVDGVERTVYTLNRQMPGPSIHVCVGDIIQVDLKVELPGHAETLHWHGLPQAQSPWFDGVAWVTQCPVLFGNKFRYEFVAEPAGSYFYHSHSGLHKVNGIAGPLIIRQPRWLDLHADLYDYDLPQHTVVLHDWMHVPAEFVFPGLTSRLTGQPSDNLLINGMGNFLDVATNSTTKTPIATFEVEPGKRYRFRFINSGSLSCPIQVQFEDHQMNVISSDGLDIVPQVADTLYTVSGERWDVVISARQWPSRSAYWIYVRTVGFCADTGTTEQRALLIYKTGQNVAPSRPAPGVGHNKQFTTGVVVNSLGDCEPASQVCASELSTLMPVEELSTLPHSKAAKLIVFRLRFAVRPPQEIFAKNSYERFLAFGPATLSGVLNDIVFRPPNAPFLTQPGQAHHCNEKLLPLSCKGKEVCECSHLIKVRYGVAVDVLVVDVTDTKAGDNSTNLLGHPMHLHGTSFAAMAMGTLRNITSGKDRVATVHALYDRGALPTQVSHPAMKDVMVLPGGGYIWFRFRADNPGVWFFHCHFQYHMASGMEAAIQVGESSMFLPPPPGFPTCGDFTTSKYYLPEY